jgi:di/tricarboxylate transporter
VIAALEGLVGVDVGVLLAVAILGLVLVALVRELASPAAVMVGGLTLFVLVGILPPKQAFVGFSSPATISIAGLFVVARAVRERAGLEAALSRLLGDGTRGPRRILTRLIPPVIGLSSVTNNTPIVAAAAPLVRGWAERRGVASTQLLIPLSFAAILGGVITTIGTSPNLVVSGVLEASGHSGLDFFEITPAGLPMAVLGGTLIIALAPRLMPDRRTPHERIAGHERDYALRLVVVPGGEVDGRAVAEAGLRDLETTYLASVVRDGREMAPVPPDTLLRGGDELVFVGRVDEVRDLLDRPGLVEAESAQTTLLDGDGHRLTECVLGPTSRLVGQTLKSASFRGRYGGAVLAIHRAGERVAGKLGQVRLRSGDALLVLADEGFRERWQGSTDFGAIAMLEDGPAPVADRHRWLTIGTLLGMLVLAASGLTSIVTAVLLACSVLVVGRALTFRQALDALDRDVLLIVASAMGLGVAMQSSGLADLLANGIGSAAQATGPLVALALVVVGTLVLTELITNVAAAALMVPIAIGAAERVDFDPTGFAVAVALAASSSFLTPIGYQTNTIVYGLGGYRFGDYWRLGLPLAVGTLVTALIVVPVVWG